MNIQLIKTFKNKPVSIMWFRRDFRLSDNPALVAAMKKGNILPIYIHDDTKPKEFQLGEASSLWLYHSLNALNQSLKKQLKLYIGNPKTVIKKLSQKYQITGVFWNQSDEAYERKTDTKIKTLLKTLNIECQAFHGNHLWQATEILKNDGSFYKVFSAYKKKAKQTAFTPITPTPTFLFIIHDAFNTFEETAPNIFAKQHWQKKIEKNWDIGELSAQKKLMYFIEEKLATYAEKRDYPTANNTSKLSPHLHFGEISPRTIWHKISTNKNTNFSQKNIECFFDELIWREFSSYLMHHFNSLHEKNFNAKFNLFPWKKNSEHLQKWQRGQTGYPFIDAGMRELWQTGFMHNRVRMVVASFLTKNLMIHWHEGRDWFWNCLVDADLENNSTNWQWVAGSGVDAAPYFRIFNPVRQGEKFDPNGEYTKTYVPELSALPTRYLFQPWLAPKNILEKAKIILGQNYPNPIIDLTLSRQEALAAYQTLTKDRNQKK